MGECKSRVIFCVFKVVMIDQNKLKNIHTEPGILDMFWSIITTLNTQKITLLLHSFNNGFKTYERNTILKIFFKIILFILKNIFNIVLRSYVLKPLLKECKPM